MDPVKPEQQKVAEKLQDALDRLQQDVKRVEIWAGALTGFTQPVPDYSAAASCDKYRLTGETDDGDASAAPSAADPRSPERG